MFNDAFTRPIALQSPQKPPMIHHGDIIIVFQSVALSVIKQPDIAPVKE